MLDRPAAMVLLSLLVSCSPAREQPPTSPRAQVEPGWSLDRSSFDDAADPCEDFYQHVCGGWIAQTTLGPEQSTVARAEALVDAANEAVLHELLEGGSTPDNAEIGRLRRFFGACMAGGTANDERTLASWLARIDAIGTHADFEVVLGDLHGVGVAALFEYSGVADPSAPTRHRGQLHQGSIAYLQGSDAVAHVERMFTLAGAAKQPAHEDAEQALAIERALAGAAIGFEEQFDPELSEHLISTDELRALVPHLDWSAYLERVGHPEREPVNVTSLAYLRALDEVLASRSPAALRAYLRWKWLRALGPALPGEHADEHARFMGSGARPSRVAECRLATLEGLGVELSRQFALQVLGPRDRARAQAVAGRVQATMAESVASIAWLAGGSRRATVRKIDATDLKIGYPDQWPATGNFEIRDDAYLDNVLAARAYEQARSWARARAPRQREAWEMIVYPNVAHGMAAARLTVANGFPDVFSNSIILPAASLQAPLFDAHAPPEVGYATLGSLVAHELAHVFENHEFDEYGAYRPLWIAADVQAHRERAACVVEQANGFVIQSVALDGQNTIEENLADLRGLAVAYQTAARERGAMGELGDDGLTPAQRFFYAYAQRWCTAQTPARALETLRHDWHAPPRFRVNGPLANLPEFADAFSCSKDASMVRPESERCAAW